MRKVSAFIFAAAAWSFAGPAAAYPTSVIFAPTGDVREFGSVNTFAFAGANARATDATSGEKGVAFSSAWVGVGFGIAPSLAYTKTLRFGGVEVGANVLAPDLRGTSELLPIFDAKFGLLAEGDYHPAVAVGLIGLAPRPKQMLNFGYLSLSKSLQIDGTSYGQLTLGIGRAFVPSSQMHPGCATSGDPCAFRGSAPFQDANASLLAGYLTPSFGPVSFAIDHVGGTSALSSTNLAVNLQVVTGGYFSLGAWFSNDRRDEVTGGTPADGMFASVSISGSLKDMFSGGASPPEPSPAPAAVEVVQK